MDWLWTILNWIGDESVRWARENPVLAGLLILGFLARFGTVVQTGWTGVLFVFGRACRELEPGFHWLLPLICSVRKVPVRSVSLALPTQLVSTADGLVYEVQANLVYHIAAPTRAVTQVAELRQGMLVLLPMIVQEVLRRQTRATLLQERDLLEKEYSKLAAASLRRWGVEVEQAGFPTITPTRRTLRLTQLVRQTLERRRMLDRYCAAGLSLELALALLGSERRVLGRTAGRFRKVRYRHRSEVRRARLAQRELHRQTLLRSPADVANAEGNEAGGTPVPIDQMQPQGARPSNRGRSTNR